MVSSSSSSCIILSEISDEVYDRINNNYETVWYGVWTLATAWNFKPDMEPARCCGGLNKSLRRDVAKITIDGREQSRAFPYVI